jgi:hypothetical protein
MTAARVLSRLAVIAGLLLASGAGSTCLAQPEEDPAGAADGARVLTNADVVQMLKSGLGDDAVIAAIQKARTEFDLGSSSLAELRYAGVSDSVIVAMLASRAAQPPASPNAAPAPAEPATAPVVAPPPTPPAETRPVERAAAEKAADRPRGGGVFGLALGGHSVLVLDDDGVDEDGFDDDDPRFGASLGLQVGGHVARHTVILADIHAALWPETETYTSGGLFSLGPAVRFSPVRRLSLEGGVSFAVATPDWDNFTNEDPWLGPAGHLGLGMELTSGRSSFALELRARFDLAYLSPPFECDSCDASALGWASAQLAFTWY